jgi:hypothetical protein
MKSAARLLRCRGPSLGKLEDSNADGEQVETLPTVEIQYCSRVVVISVKEIRSRGAEDTVPYSGFDSFD